MPGSVPDSVPKWFGNFLTQFTCASKLLFVRDLVEATRTGLEPATTGSTVRDSNQLSYRARVGDYSKFRSE